jgi:hypothetical protein
MCALILGVISFVSFFFFSIIFSNRRFFPVYLIAAMIISFVLWCVSARFLSNDGTNEWVNCIFLSIPMSSMLMLDNHRQQRKKQKTSHPAKTASDKHDNF